MATLKTRIEKQLLEKQLENLEAAKRLVGAFPEHKEIRIAWRNGVETHVLVGGLSFDEKIMKVYRHLNKYIKIE